MMLTEWRSFRWGEEEEEEEDGDGMEATARVAAVLGEPARGL
jgi:chaperone required for assembly of F1-ATPase